MVDLRRWLPILTWAPGYARTDAHRDLAAGLTVGAMLVPQAMAYALLAGLPPEVGLYAATVPLLVYAVFSSSRHLAVGPAAITSLLTASALAPLAAEGTADHIAAAALLAVMVGIVHIGLGAGRLGFLVDLLSHSVLVGFTAAAAVIIGSSQVEHVLGVPIEGSERFDRTLVEVARHLGDTHPATLAVGALSLVALLALKRVAPRLPAALLVVIGSSLAVELLDLDARGVAVVGDIPGSLPPLSLPVFDGSLIVSLAPTALVITLVGFLQSIAAAKVYARRHRHELDADAELVGLGAANLAAGLFGGYPVTGGLSRTAVNDAAGARTPVASIATAGVVIATVAFFTPLLSSLPSAALGAIIITAVTGLIDVAEMRHIARVARTDLISLGVTFAATLLLGIELGIAVAVVASMLVVFARLSLPHSAVLGRVEGTTSYRNIERFPEACTEDGIRVVRIDAALSFVNAARVKKLILGHADALTGEPRALVLDASGVNDLDATGAAMLDEVLPELEERGVALHLSDVKGPVRDVLRRAGLWQRLDDRIHTSSHDAVSAIVARSPGPADQRRSGVDERGSGRPALTPR